MRKSKIKQISLAVCLALMPYSAFSAGLGKLNVSSGLGEPFNAEVELLSVSPDELSTLVAAIASEEAYAAQGIARLGIHNTIKVEVAKSVDGSPILKIHSSQPVSDPYLDMLIQVDWASGRLQREYTVLLDPPGYKQTVEQSAPASIIQAPVVSQTLAETSTSEASVAETKSKKPKKSNKQALVEDKLKDVDSDSLTTKRGDTLNSIARKMQMEGVSLDQMLVGLYESNQDAFSNGNMNQLKVGQIIKVPAKESLASVDVQQAKQSIKVHSENWNAYRNTLAGAVASTPASTEVEHKQTSSGKIATAEDKAATVKTGPQDVVKLSAGEKDLAKVNKDAAKAADAKVTALQEEATAREKTLKEAQDRAAALEKQIQDMQKLLALKSQTMLELQKNAESSAKAPVAKVEEKPAPVAEVKAPELVKPVEEVAKPELTEKPQVKPEEKVESPAPKPKKHLAPPPPPPPEPSFLESIMNVADLTIIGGTAGVGLLGAIWLFLRNKRRKDLDSFERGILTSGGLRANTVFGNTTGNATTADTSFLTDFAQSTNGSMIDANDVDPIAEAEVYMAYGRDAQAEEILKDAISKEPKRYELHLKLLEIYAGRRDASAFVDIAGELYTTLGASDPMWAKVAEMGAAIEPDNPLYDLGKVAGNSSDIGRKLDASDFADVEVSTDDGLDFSLDAELASVEPEKTAEIASLDMPGFSESLVEQESSVGLDLNLNANNDEILTESESPDLTSFNMAVESAPVEDVANQEASIEKVMDFDLSELGAVADNVPEVVEAEQVEPMVSEIGLDANVEEVMDFDLGLAGELATEASHSETSAQPSVEATLPEIDFSSAPSIDFTSTKSSDEDDLKFEMPVAEVATDALSDFDFNLPTEPQDQDADKVIEKVASAIGDISFDLGEVADIEAESSLPESVLEMPVAESVELEEPATSEPAKKSKASSKVADDSAVELEQATSIKSDPDNQANEFDLSSISLDLDDALNAASIDFSSAADDLNQDSGQESADVEVKLDLVAAYIDMDDREGARELLEEVMKEGGPQQQARAQQLLDSLA